MDHGVGNIDTFFVVAHEPPPSHPNALSGLAKAAPPFSDIGGRAGVGPSSSCLIGNASPAKFDSSRDVSFNMTPQCKVSIQTVGMALLSVLMSEEVRGAWANKVLRSRAR